MDFPLRGFSENASVFEQIYESFVDDVYRLCLSFMKNIPDTEDVVQETFIRLYRSEKSFSSIKHIKGWLLVTASNLCKDHLRSHWHKRANLEKVEDYIGYEQPYDEMIEIIQGLPEKYRIVVFLYYYEDYDTSEIAKFLRKSPRTIRLYLKKAREMLKGLIEQ